MCQSSLQEHVLNAGKDARIIYRITNMAALPLLVTLSQLLYIGQGSFLLTLKISLFAVATTAVYLYHNLVLK